MSTEPIDYGNFSIRDLPNILDRVEAPISIELNDDTLIIHAAYPMSWGSSVQVEAGDAPGDIVTMSLDGACMAEFAEAPTVLGAPKDVVAYMTRDGEMLCADHGAPFDLGIEDDGDVHPVLRDHSGDYLDAVEYCNAGLDRGHSFCGTCGTDLETTRGAHDRDLEGPFSRCWNCDTTAVDVDGEGYQWVDRFAAILDTHTVTVRGVEAYCQTNTDGTTRIREVDDDNAPGVMRKLQAYVAWVELDPSSGMLLILCEDEDEALETADYWAEEKLDLDEYPEDEREDVLSDRRADTRVQRVDVENIDFTPNRNRR